VTAPGGACRVWCALYTLAVPQPDRTRRREELHAHLQDATVTWGDGWRTRLRLARQSARGAIADLQWCDDVRRSHRVLPLATSALIGPVGPTVIAGLLITFALLMSLIGAIPAAARVKDVSAVLAAVVVTASMTARLLRWRTRR
jgi:hypothetical protein